MIGWIPKISFPLKAAGGARVIKIERPQGDFTRCYDQAVKGMSTYFVWANRGKELMQLDFDMEEGRAELDALIAGADVVVSKLATGALAKRGLDGQSLRKVQPNLITCEISGFGPNGPIKLAARVARYSRWSFITDPQLLPIHPPHLDANPPADPALS